MVSNKEYNLKTLLDQEEIDRLDYNKRMKLAQVKISLNAKFKDTTEVKYKYSELSIKRTGCNKRTGGKILSKQLSEQDVISEQGGGNSLKQLSKQDVLSKQKQEKQHQNLSSK